MLGRGFSFLVLPYWGGREGLLFFPAKGTCTEHGGLGVHQNRFSLGVGAEVIIHHLGIYYKYDPFPVLRSSYGPKFSSMTVGLKVAF